MNKSTKDIDEQLKRVLALAETIGGKYTANAKHQVDMQYYAQIARRAKTQHGFGIFDKNDPNERRPFIYQEPPQKIVEAVDTIILQESTKPKETPTEKAHNRVSFSDWMGSDEKNRYQVQMACRHNFINKMYAEMLTDMEICKMEGWDILAFPRMLRDAVARCFPKPKQLSLFKDI